MSKIIIIGKQKGFKRSLKPIKLQYILNIDIEIHEINGDKASDYRYIELICRNYSEGYDLIFCYQNPQHRENGVLYIGEWNDGVVE